MMPRTKDQKSKLAGIITTFAGTGVAGNGGDGGPACRQLVVIPPVFATDISGNLYVSDSTGVIRARSHSAGTHSCRYTV